MTERARYVAQALNDVAASLLIVAGMPADKAAAVADVLVDADLMGHATHGLQLLPSYLEQIASGGMTLSGDPDILSDHGAVVTWDGKRLPGAWLMQQAIAVASERARQFGIGAVSVRNSHHIGALATYARRVAEQDLVLLLMSSAPAGASVAPYGGTRAVFSPSPIGVGIPTSGDAVVVDVSTSITTNTLTSLRARAGEHMPGDWLLDEAGVPTNDPAVVIPPRTGTILPLGGMDAGHKGYGLSLMVESLTTGLAGHGRAENAERLGATLFVQIIDPRAFGGIAGFTTQMDALTKQCHDNPPIDASCPVRLPGERALQRRRSQLEHGVELDERIIEGLEAWARRLQVTWPPGSAAIR
ncbi:Ldh family oxidoreductase [Pigmentiphaga litoralis]|uniref:Ldh family oxidoreductase n=1 Tax=Pigmentiphaga litoralis TaxID=516702 RepID=UPI003B437040